MKNAHIFYIVVFLSCIAAVTPATNPYVYQAHHIKCGFLLKDPECTKFCSPRHIGGGGNCFNGLCVCY